MRILQIAFLIIIQSLVSRQCPLGWEQYTGTTDKCIAAFGEKSSYMGAHLYCNNHGARLVSIHNAFQNTQVANVARQKFSNCDYWIGFNDLDGKDVYRWSDGSSENYVNWAPGQPVFKPSGTAAYLSLTAGNRWYTTSSLSSSNCFVCEKISSYQPTTPQHLTTNVPNFMCHSPQIRQKCGEYSELGYCVPVGSSNYKCYCYETHSYRASCINEGRTTIIDTSTTYEAAYPDTTPEGISTSSDAEYRSLPETTSDVFYSAYPDCSCSYRLKELCGEYAGSGRCVYPGHCSYYCLCGFPSYFLSSSCVMSSTYTAEDISGTTST